MLFQAWPIKITEVKIMKDNLNNGNITISHLIFIPHLQCCIHSHCHQTAAGAESSFSTSLKYIFSVIWRKKDPFQRWN